MKTIELISPKNNTKLIVNKPLVRKYLKDSKKAFQKCDLTTLLDFDKGVDIRKYNRDNKKDTKQKFITLKFKPLGFNDKEKYVVTVYSEDKHFYQTYVTDKNFIKVVNLIPKITYCWFVSSLDNSVKSLTFEFMVEDDRRLIYLPHAYNVRDIGGLNTIDNKEIKYGLLFRGIELTTKKYLSVPNENNSSYWHDKQYYPSDKPYFYNLGIKVDLDLRDDNESVFIKKCPLEDKNHKFKYVRESVNAYNSAYKDMIEGRYENYKHVFELIANADKEPIYLHCWGGADRTGTIAFMLEAMLGVNLYDLVTDYELTCFAGNRRSVLPPIKGYDPCPMDWNFNLMAKMFNEYRKEKETLKDTMIRFLINEVKLSMETIIHIQDIFLE